MFVSVQYVLINDVRSCCGYIKLVEYCAVNALCMAINIADAYFWVCRAAMLGYVILAYVEYNQELRKAATLVYSRLQQQGGIGL